MTDRPLSATVISWLWIISCCGLLFNTAERFCFAAFIEANLPQEEEPQLINDVLTLVGGTFIEALLTVLIAVVGIAGSIGLLRLQEWGRRVLLVYTWLSMLVGVPGVIHFAVFLSRLFTPPGETISSLPAVFWVVCAVQVVFVLVLNGVVLGHLHGKTIRDAIHRCRSAGVDTLKTG